MSAWHAETNFKQLDSSWPSVLAVSLPMILTTLSHHLLTTIDRFMLMGFSADAMNAVSVASHFCAVLNCFFNGLAGTAEIFVGQYNGAKQYQMLAQPSWQMIYFALLASFFYLPIGYWSEYINLFPACYLQAGANYQRIVLYGGPISMLYMALAAFFIGRGRSLLVTVVMLIGALCNLVLDYLLIYGVAAWGIVAGGEKGAAIATVLTQLLQVGILASYFLNATNRQYCQTAQPRWLPRLFKQMLVVGAPVALNEAATFFAWYLIVAMVSHTSRELNTIYTLSLNLYLITIFVGDGLCKASAAINANLIPQSDLVGIRAVVKKLSSLAVGVILTITLFILLAGYYYYAIKQSAPVVVEINGNGLAQGKLTAFYTLLITHRYDLMISGGLLLAGVILESLLLVLWGVLLAGGDTSFAARTYQFFLWLGVVFPVTVTYFSGHLHYLAQPYFYSLCWSGGTLICFWQRYRSLKWYRCLI